MAARKPRIPSGGKGASRYPYGGDHRKARAAALKQLQPGEPCPYCGLGMYPEQALDLDHEQPIATGGADGPRRLTHAACNRSAGARLGNRMRSPVWRPAVSAPPRPESGAPCYCCHRPMLAGQRLYAGPAADGSMVWVHEGCSTRWVSVALDTL